MIVGDADRDLEMATDPFLEAGIDIPNELPYQTPMAKKKFSGLSLNRKDVKTSRTSPPSSMSSLANASLSTMININNNIKNFDRKIGPRKRKGTPSTGNHFQASGAKTFLDFSHPLQISEVNGKHDSPFSFTFPNNCGNGKVISSLTNFDQSPSIETINEETSDFNQQISRYTSIIEEENEDDDQDEKEKNTHVDIEVSNNSHISKGSENTSF